MIPDADEVARATRFFCANHASRCVVHDGALRVALREAAHLAEDVYEEPAAMLYALGRNPRAFGSYAPALIVLIVLAHARALGLRIDASAESLLELTAEVLERRASYEDARDALARWQWPFAG